MQELEALAAGLEQLTETGEVAKEWAGSTEVCNFEGCQLISNEQLADYLNETLPLSHLEGCPTISFDPDNSTFLESPNTLGFYETGSHAIHIADETRFVGSEGLLETVTHEVGHNAYAGFIEGNSELAKQWEDLYKESMEKYTQAGGGFVSDYAATNKYEDFAESYMNYIRNPEKLQIVCPEKYEFLRDYVFAGHEYQPQILAYWTYDSAGNKIEVTSTGVYDLQGNRIASSL